MTTLHKEGLEKPRTVSCPTCRKPAVYAASNPCRPFCSALCKDRDIIAWAEGSYAIPGPPSEELPPGAREDSDGDD